MFRRTSTLGLFGRNNVGGNNAGGNNDGGARLPLIGLPPRGQFTPGPILGRPTAQELTEFNDERTREENQTLQAQTTRWGINFAGEQPTLLEENTTGHETVTPSASPLSPK